MVLGLLKVCSLMGVAAALIENKQSVIGFDLIEHFNDQKANLFREGMIIAMFNKAVRYEQFEVCLLIFERYEPTMITQAREMAYQLTV